MKMQLGNITQNTNTNKGQSFPDTMNIEPHHFSLGSITLAKPAVLVRYKDHATAALPIVVHQNANTDWICSKVILSAQHFQHLMLNHWVLTAEPIDKVFEGTYFATKNQKDIFFKTRGPTTNSLYKYVFTAHQRRHLCKLTGLTNYGTAGNPNTNTVLCINAAQKDTERGCFFLMTNNN